MAELDWINKAMMNLKTEKCLRSIDLHVMPHTKRQSKRYQNAPEKKKLKLNSQMTFHPTARPSRAAKMRRAPCSMKHSHSLAAAPTSRNMSKTKWEKFLSLRFESPARNLLSWSRFAFIFFLEIKTWNPPRPIQPQRRTTCNGNGTLK